MSAQICDPVSSATACLVYQSRGKNASGMHALLLRPGRMIPTRTPMVDLAVDAKPASKILVWPAKVGPEHPHRLLGYLKLDDAMPALLAHLSTPTKHVPSDAFPELESKGIVFGVYARRRPHAIVQRLLASALALADMRDVVLHLHAMGGTEADLRDNLAYLTSLPAGLAVKAVCLVRFPLRHLPVATLESIFAQTKGEYIRVYDQGLIVPHHTENHCTLVLQDLRRSGRVGLVVTDVDFTGVPNHRIDVETLGLADPLGMPVCVMVRQPDGTLSGCARTDGQSFVHLHRSTTLPIDVNPHIDTFDGYDDEVAELTAGSSDPEDASVSSARSSIDPMSAAGVYIGTPALRKQTEANEECTLPRSADMFVGY